MLKTLLVGAAFALLAAVPAFAACTEISSKTVVFSGCIDSGWRAIEGTGAQEFSYLTPDQNFGFVVIAETLDFPMDKFRDAIIDNAMIGSGAEVKVVREHTLAIGGQPFNVVEYTIPNNGAPILFQNYYYSAPGFGSIQLLFYSLEASATSSAFRAGAFAATVKLGK